MVSTRLADSPVISRAAAVAVLVALLAAVFAVVVAPAWAKHREYRESIEQSTDRIQRYRRLIATRPLLEKRVQALEQALDQSGYFIDKDTPALASAYLQQQLTDWVKSAGGQLHQTQVVEQEQEGEFRRIAVRATMSGNIKQAQRILLEIERNRPLLTVEAFRVDVHRERVRVQRGNRRVHVQRIRLVFHFDVAGYMRTAA